MKRKAVFFTELLAVMVAGRVFAQAAEDPQGMPSWWLGEDSSGAEHYVSGRGAASIGVEGEVVAWREARDSALGDAAIALSPSVESEREDMEAEIGSGLGARTEAYYRQRAVVRATLRQLPELKDLDHQRMGEMVYIRVGIPRRELEERCRWRQARAATALTTALSSAEVSMRARDPNSALRFYEEALGERDVLDENLNVLAALGAPLIESPALPPAAGRAALQAALARAAGSIPETDRTRLLARLLEAIEPGAVGGERFFVAPLAYEGSDFVSPFGSNLADAVAAAIAERTAWWLVRDPLAATWLFEGRVSEAEPGVQITLRSRKAAAPDERLAVAFVPRSALDTLGWGSVKPENWEQALRDEAALRRRMAETSGLRIELRTDQAPGTPVVLRYGDRPRLWVRVDRPCKVRVLHVFSDGTNTLLIDDYPISMDRINQWLVLPVRMRITPPAGIEQLLAQAVADGELPRLSIEEVRTGSYSKQLIVKGRLDEALAQARGSCIEDDAIFGEAVLGWTILER